MIPKRLPRSRARATCFDGVLVRPRCAFPRLRRWPCADADAEGGDLLDHRADQGVDPDIIVTFGPDGMTPAIPITLR